ncbi:MAG: S8 family serine peptidase [Deferribacterota bacterium]|nr:S8 family serine peptidase [Deferribacterota bacterium]
MKIKYIFIIFFLFCLLRPLLVLGQIHYIPNDPYFKYQTYLHNEYNNMEDLGYLPYYNYFKEHKKEILDKYKTIKGNLPVLAIIDSDYDPFDEDISNRLWKNSDEVPYNGVDDDGNGWVDDYMVMNFINQNVYRVSGGRSETIEELGSSLYGTVYPPQGIFMSNPNYHGHYMALLAGAEQDNNIGYHGILPKEVKILTITVGHKENPNVTANNIAIRDGLDYIVDMKSKGLINTVAVNMSFGTAFPSENYFGYDVTFGKGAFEEKLEQLNSSGINYIVAAGNEAHDIDIYSSYPAAFNQPNGIVVGAAANYNAIRAWSSNYGRNTVDIFTVAEKEEELFEYNYKTTKGFYLTIDDDINSSSSATAITSAVYTVASLLYPECNNLQLKQLILDSYMDKENLYGLTKAYNRVTHDGITRLSGEGRNELGNLIGLITKDVETGEQNYHLNVELRKKICGR